MWWRHKSLLRSFAIVGLSVFTIVGIAHKASGTSIVQWPISPPPEWVKKSGYFCHGQWRTDQDCETKSGKASAGVNGSSFPLTSYDCSVTCQKWNGTHEGCSSPDPDSHASSFCGKLTPLVKYEHGPVSGNQCGYVWYSITCWEAPRPTKQPSLGRQK